MIFFSHLKGDSFNTTCAPSVRYPPAAASLVTACVCAPRCCEQDEPRRLFPPQRRQRLRGDGSSRGCRSAAARLPSLPLHSLVSGGVVRTHPRTTHHRRSPPPVTTTTHQPLATHHSPPPLTTAARHCDHCDHRCRCTIVAAASLLQVSP